MKQQQTTEIVERMNLLLERKDADAKIPTKLNNEKNDSILQSFRP